MSEYGDFARVYDLFMDEIPYQAWSDYLEMLLKDHGITEGLLLELGCGTGTMTELMAEKGYDMTGIDSSAEMLQEALLKKEKSGLDILYLNQDMRSFELYGTMRAVFAVCDTMNYLLTRRDLLKTLKLVNNYLDPGGLFIFDLKTEHYYRDVLGERTEAAEEETASYIWQNYYDRRRRINEYALTVFEQKNNGMYERFSEYHEQRAWSIEEIREMAERAGMEFVAVYEAMKKKKPGRNAERIYVILKERGKKHE